MSASKPARRAFTVLEILISLGMLALIATAIATTYSQVQRARAHLAARRTLLRAAEEALAERQAGTAPWWPQGVQVKLEPMPQPEGWNPAAGRWVQAVATDGVRTETLAGVVPAEGGRP